MSEILVSEKKIHAKFFTQFDNFTLDVDLTLPLQGVTVVFGASGSGKTSFLRCLAGLEKAEQGVLNIGETLWQDADTFLPTHKRSMGYVFQEASLFEHLTVKGNLLFALKRAEKKKTESDLSLDKVCEILAITHLLDQSAQSLSGGEKQRVAIARALLIQPQILLMDEPLASLDNAMKLEILPLLEDIRRELNIPIIYISHSMNEVTRLADHVVVLKQGRVLAQGSVTEVFNSPEFYINDGSDKGVIIEGYITGRDEHWGLAEVSFNAQTSEDARLFLHNASYEKGQSVRLRILAKDVSLTLTQHSDTSILNILPGKVISVHSEVTHAEVIHEGSVLVEVEVSGKTILAQITKRSAHLLSLVDKDGCFLEEKNVWVQIKSVALLN